MAGPTIGDIVIYRSRTGNYDVPAIVTATVDTLAEVGVKMYEEMNGEQGVPPLSSDRHVHLHVLTPGIPGMRAAAQDFQSEGLRRAENIGGAYQEWDIAPDPVPGAGVIAVPSPGTWRHPVNSDGSPIR